MSLIYNGTTVEEVLYNGGGVQQISWNGTTVFVGKKPYEDYLNTSSISITDFLNKVCIVDTFDDNQATNFVGKTITGITNTYDSASNVDWEIIDYNHDGSTGTFDLMAKKTIKDSVKFYNSNYNQNYEYSDIRTWLQSYVNNFSSTNSDLYNHIATMDVEYNFNTNQPNNQAYSNYPGDSNRNTTGSNKHTLNDKIKLLSGTELGYGYTSDIDYMPYNEGNVYSNKFSRKTSTSADSSMIRYSGSSDSAIRWWTRSRRSYSINGGSVWYVDTDGQLNVDYTSLSRSVVPAIRLSVI